MKLWFQAVKLIKKSIDELVIRQLISFLLVFFCPFQFYLSFGSFQRYFVELSFLEIVTYTVIFEKEERCRRSAVYFAMQIEYGLSIYIGDRCGQWQ